MLFYCKIKEFEREITFLVESENDITLEKEIESIFPFIAEYYELRGGSNSLFYYEIADEGKTTIHHIFKKQNDVFVEVKTVIGKFDLLTRESNTIVKYATQYKEVKEKPSKKK